MRIRQIELFGFKSFRDHTRLAFNPGLNAIVGPNGCGKSNVADAIRWALGEQSVKHLRAKEMEDVIFCGNAKSPPLNLAEIVLTFEQTDAGALPVASEEDGLASHVARLAEFTVKRQIFRSGESHYFINDAPARLRDVTELFLGSGVGPKAYAMIEQGRVTQIVNAKPEELRLFIEEAAGTTLFRSRKIACERKLERTTENLARVKDVMREIERQLSALRRQAKRAEEFKALEKELRDTELALAAERWHALTADCRALEEALRAASDAQHEAQGSVQAHEAKRGEAAAAERLSTERIERAFATLGEASEAVVRITERQTAIQEAQRAIDGRLVRGRSELDDLARKEEDLAARLREVEARRQEAADRARAAEDMLAAAQHEVDSVRPRFERSAEEHAQALGVLNEDRGRAAGAAERRAEATTRATALAEQRDRLVERRASRCQDLAAAEVRRGESTAALDEARAAHARLSADQVHAAAALRAGEDEVRRLEESQVAVREAMVLVRGRLDGLRSREQAYDGYAEGITTVMGLEPRPRGLVMDALEIPTELEPAVAAVLGDLLRGAVVDTTEDGAALAGGLRRAGDGRVSLVPLAARGEAHAADDLPAGTTLLGSRIGVRGGHEDLRSALFGSVALAEDLDTAVAAWRAHGNGLSWVTRAGDVIDRRGIVTGGKALRGTELLARRRALGELTAQLAQDEVRLAAIELRLGQAREECAALASRLRELDAQAHSATLALVAAQHAADAARRERDAAQARVAEAEADVAAAEDKAARAELALHEADAEARLREEAVAASELRVAQAEQQLEAQRQHLHDTTSRRDAARETVTATRQDLAAAEGERTRLAHEHTLLGARRVSLEAELAELAAQQEASGATLAQLASDLEQARAALARGEGEMEEARRAAKESQERLREAETALTAARRALETAREQCRDLDVRSAERRAQLDALAGFTWERHGVEAATLTVPEGFDATTASERVAELKERIAKLGEVNVTAITDARELEERLGFLDSQRSDLESSMEDLNRTIAELSRTTRTRFRDTFEKANEKFREIFVELFRGGSASLKLTNPSNLLETGVEIEAQPPGKRVGNTMLSGGERALTAVSLIMALFSLRATPFCLLDEVDAPLDDANVSRFNALLTRMSETTQFIVITHNQRTMEACHSLYGVTMPEPGVSQVVSVSLGGRREPVSLAANA